MTRPDLAWSCSELSKYVQVPGQSHMEEAEHVLRYRTCSTLPNMFYVTEHVLRYLRATWNETITYTRRSRRVNESWGWVDADWAGDTDTHRSHMGYILMMNGGPISWKSCRQDSVSLST